MGSGTLPRSYVAVIASAVLVLLVVQIAVAREDAGADPKASASAPVRQQVTKLKRQLAQLRQQVQNIQLQPGPPGQQGAPGPSTGPAGGDLAGNFPNPQIAANAVGSPEVLDQSLTTDDLGPNSVASSEVFDTSLTVDDLGTASVGSSEAINNSLTSDDIGTDAIQSSELAPGAVLTENVGPIPTARVRRTTGVNVNSGALTAISFTSETWDVGGLHSGTDNFLNAPIDGIYLITAHVLFNSGGGGLRELAIDVNNTKGIADVQDDAHTSASDFFSLATVYSLNAGDDVRMKVQQSTGAPLGIIASSGGPETSPELSMTWLGPG